MTLNTRIWLHGTISGEDAFALSLRSLLRAADREDKFSTARVERKRDFISTAIGQGLPGIVDCGFRADGSPLAIEDVWDTEFENDHYIDQRKCHVQLSWDTAYSYSDNGIGCSELHARALVNLFQGLPDGVTMTWQNEFTGDIFDGLDGLEEFIGDGVEARVWWRQVAAPAIATHIARA